MKTRKDYEEKFNRLFSQYNYIPQDREQIVQCQKPYPPYMFISNRGYLWSAYRDELYLMKPHPKATGRKNKEGKRAGLAWDYCIYDRHVDMAKIMADHFLENEFDAEEYHIHHKQKRNTFSINEPQKCNRADNLQILPKEVHIELTKLASKTFEERDKELRAEVSKRNVPTVHLPQQQMVNLLVNAINSSLQNGGEPFVNLCSMADNKNDILAEAHPVKGIETDKPKK